VEVDGGVDDLAERFSVRVPNLLRVSLESARRLAQREPEDRRADETFRCGRSVSWNTGVAQLHEHLRSTRCVA
jgi:hypothetical protein